MLLRSLVPSWKLFEDIGHTAVLLIRQRDSDETWGEWRPVHQPIQKKIYHLFYNPELNLQLAEKSALQHAMIHLSEEDRKNSVSVEIIRNIVNRYISRESLGYQFKISVFNQDHWEDIFISEPEI